MRHRLITTLEQLNACTVGTIVLDASGDAMQLEGDGWYLGDELEMVNLPARVLLESWER